MPRPPAASNSPDCRRATYSSCRRHKPAVHARTVSRVNDSVGVRQRNLRRSCGSCTSTVRSRARPHRGDRAEPLDDRRPRRRPRRVGSRRGARARPDRRVGRPSPVVAARSARRRDRGQPRGRRPHDRGRRTRTAASRARARIEVDRPPHPRGDRDGSSPSSSPRGAASDLAGRRIVGVGLAVPGLVRASDGLVRNAPHLRWTRRRAARPRRDATGLPVVVGNDATHGRVAEHLFGAARGIDDVVYLNGGASGIGGGLIVQRDAGDRRRRLRRRVRPEPPGHRRRQRIARADDGVLEDEVSRARLLAALGRSQADEPTLAAALAPRARRRCARRSPDSAASSPPHSRTPSTCSTPPSSCWAGSSRCSPTTTSTA